MNLAQLAAALSQQVQNQSSLLKNKRSLETQETDDKEESTTPSTKQPKLSEMDMAAKIQELEAKYESLKNNSMKLAAAVINSDKVPDEAKDIINQIEKNWKTASSWNAHYISHYCPLFWKKNTHRKQFKRWGMFGFENRWKNYCVIKEAKRISLEKQSVTVLMMIGSLHFLFLFRLE